MVTLMLLRRAQPVVLMLIVAALFLIGCTPLDNPPGTTDALETPSSEQLQSPPAEPDKAANALETAPSPDDAVGLTNQRLDGNRVVEGYTDLSQITPVDVPLAGVPAWVASIAVDDGVVWGVVLEDGRTQAVRVAHGTVEVAPTFPERLPAGMPPTLQWLDGVATFVVAPGDASPSTNAVPVGETLVGIHEDGDLIIGKGDTTQIFDADALPDARLLTDSAGRVLFYSSPTDRYAHGVLGDALEAGSMTLAHIEPALRIVGVIETPLSSVLEGIAPIWADLDGDGVREVIATLSDAENGARIVVYREDGAIAAEGPAVGQGYRWRHPIAVAPFGPERTLELASVLTPHIGGVVEFYALQEGALHITASLPGYTSHVLGSRNLDMALAASPSDKGQAILLTPSQNRTQIGAVRRTLAGAETVWTIDVGGTMVTNTAAESLPDDQIGVAVGRSDGILRVWQPDSTPPAVAETSASP